MLVVGAIAVIDVDDVGMAQLGDQLDLTIELSADPRVSRKAVLEYFQRDATLQPRMLGEIHSACATNAQGAQDAVSTDDGIRRFRHVSP